MKYLQKQLNDKKGMAVWLASYPKSGNTWFRCFLSALFTGEVNLARLKTDGIFSSRHIFDRIADVDSRLLTQDQVNKMLPDVFSFRVKTAPQLQFIKVHDAYYRNKQRKAIFPADVTHKVVYLIRNPLDIVASFANHNATTIDNTIKLMNNPNGALAGGTKGLNINTQFRQLMYDWSGHVESWNNQKELDVILVRYEDMLHDSFDTFSRVVKEMGIEASKTAIQKAIRMSKFSKLKKKEDEKGFREKNIRSERFFRSGKSGQYHNELTPEQIDSIIKAHKKTMKKYGYL